MHNTADNEGGLGLDKEQRRLLFDIDRHPMQRRSQVGETDAAMIGLTGTCHNLLRQWAEV
jgi:PKHD-type hydroxylase